MNSYSKVNNYIHTIEGVVVYICAYILVHDTDLILCRWWFDTNT